MKAVDLTEQRFGRLLAIKSNGKDRHGNTLWECRCDCGTVKTILYGSLVRSLTRSCGCISQERLRRDTPSKRHGYSRTPEYSALCSAIRRCKSTSPSREDYYQRGIIVCAEWRSLSKEAIESFIASVGRHPGPHFSLDRINNDEGYAPGNVRWASRSTQNSNKRYGQVIEKIPTSTLISELEKRGVEVAY
jgi:hypothetical protein